MLVNLCLALKGGVLNSIRQLGKTVENSNDTVLVNQYHRVKTLKSLHSHYIVTSKASADSVHYLLYQAEFELMDRLCRSDSVYLSNYKWKEVAKCLSKNEMAVEFFDYVKIGTDLQNEDGRTYVALVFKFQVYGDKSAEFSVVKQQVEIEILAVYYHTFLTVHKTEACTEFQYKLLKVRYQTVFE